MAKPAEYRPRVSFVDVSEETVLTFNCYIPAGERMKVLGQAMEMVASAMRKSDRPHEIVAGLIMQTLEFADIATFPMLRSTLKIIEIYLRNHPTDDPTYEHIKHLLAKEFPE